MRHALHVSVPKGRSATSICYISGSSLVGGIVYDWHAQLPGTDEAWAVLAVQPRASSMHGSWQQEVRGLSHKLLTHVQLTAVMTVAPAAMRMLRMLRRLCLHEGQHGLHLLQDLSLNHMAISRVCCCARQRLQSSAGHRAAHQGI